MNREQMIESVMGSWYVIEDGGHEYDLPMTRRGAEQIVDRLITDGFDGFDPVKARRSDPHTSHSAASLVRARAGTARVRLLEAFRNGADVEWGLTDEEAALLAGLSLSSEYATRCSELRSIGVIEFTGNVRKSRSGMERATSILTDLGQSILLARAIRETS